MKNKPWEFIYNLRGLEYRACVLAILKRKTVAFIITIKISIPTLLDILYTNENAFIMMQDLF
jgi:hypothetical protein